jgi:hypothetical protein
MADAAAAAARGKLCLGLGRLLIGEDYYSGGKLWARISFGPYIARLSPICCALS